MALLVDQRKMRQELFDELHEAELQRLKLRLEVVEQGSMRLIFRPVCLRQPSLWRELYLNPHTQQDLFPLQLRRIAEFANDDLLTVKHGEPHVSDAMFGEHPECIGLALTPMHSGVSIGLNGSHGCTISSTAACQLARASRRLSISATWGVPAICIWAQRS